MERDLQRCNFKNFICYFNSHAHVERDNPKGEYWNYFYISTHTLTWSVTQLGKEKKNKMQNFNSHAHVERDYRFSTLALYYANFNSHAHVERDT